MWIGSFQRETEEEMLGLNECKIWRESAAGGDTRRKHNKVEEEKKKKKKKKKVGGQCAGFDWK